MTTNFLTKDSILKAEDLEYEDVECPEWGGTIRIRRLTGSERDRFESTVFRKKGTKEGGGEGGIDWSNMRARLVCLTATTDEGKRLFSFQDADKLGKKSAKVLDRLFGVAQKLSGLRKEDVDDLRKNLSEDRSDDSTSS